MSLPANLVPAAPRVSIMLVTFNSAGWLPALVESLRGQTFTSWELIVVDNGSQDGSLDLVRAHQPEAHCLRNAVNEGFATANNQGLLEARGEFACLLNADVVLAPDYLEHLVDELQAHPQAGGATGKLLRLPEGGRAAAGIPPRLDSTGLFLGAGFFARDRGAGALDAGQFEEAGEVFGVCCAAALLRRAMLADVAPRGDVFPSRYVAFYEDLDLCWRARRRGWRFRYQPQAVAWHARGGSLGTKRFFGRPAPFQQHVMRNRYRTILRNSTAGQVLAQLPALAAAELLLLGYACLRAPHLLRVYGQVLRETPRLLRERRLDRRLPASRRRDPRLRLLQIAQPYGGGVQKFVLSLSRALDRRRIAVSGACSPPPSAAFSQASRQRQEPFALGFARLGIPHVTLPMVRSVSPWHDLRAFLALLRLLRREPIDVLHAHSSKAGMLARLAGLVSGVPLCYSPHAFPFLMGGGAGWRYRQMERVAARLGGVIVVESEGERRQALRAGLRSPDGLRLIPNTIPAAPQVSAAQRRHLRASLLRELDQAAADLSGAVEAPWVTMVGRLVEQKNPALFVEAAALVLRSYPMARFLIIGDGPLRPLVQDQVQRARLTGSVRLLGYRRDALDILAASSLFVLPSRWEGLPFILLEAMARRVPVVATDCVGEAGLLRDGVEGRIVPRGDASAMAAAVAALLADPEQARGMAERAVRRVAAFQDPAAMAAAFEALYHELAGLPGPSRRSGGNEPPGQARTQFPPGAAGTFPPRRATPPRRWSATPPARARSWYRARYGHESPAFAACYRQLADLSKELGRGKRILDAGCGGSPFLRQALGEEACIVGADLERPAETGLAPSPGTSEAALRHLRAARPDASPVGDPRRLQVQADLAWLPFADASFHVVAGLMVLEHLRRPRACLAEMYRVLAPGGACLLFTTNLLNPLMVASWLLPLRWKRGLARRLLTERRDAEVHPTFYRANRPGRLQSLLAATGFHEITVSLHPGTAYYMVMNGASLRLGLWWERLTDWRPGQPLKLYLLACARRPQAAS